MREWRHDWRDMFATFRIALNFRSMLLALAGLAWVVTLLVIWVYFWGKEGIDYSYPVRDGAGAVVDTRHEFLDGPILENMIARGAFSEYSLTSIKAFAQDNLIQLDGWDAVVLAAVLLLVWFFWSFLFGAINRIAAVEIARDERIELREALAFSWDKWTSLWWAPVAPLFAFGVFFVCVMLWAFLAGLLEGYFSAALMGLLSPLAVFTALIMAFIFFGLLAGRQLMGPAIAAEGTDAFDGVSRAFSFVYSKPWPVLCYRYLIGLGYNLVTSAFVWLFTAVVVVCLFLPAKFVFGDRIYLVYRFLKLDSAFQRLDDCFQDLLRCCGSFHVPGFDREVSLVGDLHVNFFSAPEALLANRERWDTGLFSHLDEAARPALGQMPKLALFDQFLGWDLSLFIVLTGALLIIGVGLAASFPLCYRATQETLMYFLLRSKVDGVKMDEVYLEDDLDQFAGIESLGLQAQPETPAPNGTPSDTADQPKSDS